MGHRCSGGADRIVETVGNMMTTPTKALIFINWNTASMTVGAVTSARDAATHPEELRVIIVDNGSTDESLETFAEQLPDAEVIAMGGNMGFARAANAGLRAVREPYAFILNTDLEFHSGVFEQLVGALNADSRGVLACPKLLRPEGSLQAAAVAEPSLFWELVNRSLPRHLLRISQDVTQSVPSVVGPCMAVHMERMLTVGLMDERFFFFFEETDWCRRFREAGLKVLYVPTAAVVHLQGETANRRPTRARIQFYSSRYRYFRKHSGLPAAAFLAAGLFVKLNVSLLIHGLLVLLTLGRRRHRDRVAVYARLWLWHFKGCPAAWGFEPPGSLDGQAVGDQA